MTDNKRRIFHVICQNCGEKYPAHTAHICGDGMLATVKEPVTLEVHPAGQKQKGKINNG